MYGYRIRTMSQSITDQQKQEIRDSLENLAYVYTDTISKIWAELGLSPTPKDKDV